MVKQSMVVATALLLVVLGTTAGFSQNPTCEARCQRVYAACASRCGPGITGAACETACDNAAQECSKKCKDTGKEFRDCIKNAGSDQKARQGCIDKYHTDWGTGR